MPALKPTWTAMRVVVLLSLPLLTGIGAALNWREAHPPVPSVTVVAPVIVCEPGWCGGFPTPR